MLVIKGTWWEETVGSVTMVSDVVVEAERLDESDSAARFHWFGSTTASVNMLQLTESPKMAVRSRMLRVE